MRVAMRPVGALRPALYLHVVPVAAFYRDTLCQRDYSISSLSHPFTTSSSKTSQTQGVVLFVSRYWRKPKYDPSKTEVDLEVSRADLKLAQCFTTLPVSFHSMLCGSVIATAVESTTAFPFAGCTARSVPTLHLQPRQLHLPSQVHGGARGRHAG